MKLEFRWTRGSQPDLGIYRQSPDVCRMIEQGDHLRRDGVHQIIDIAYEMNLGKRRMTHDELLRALHEVKG